MRSTLDISAAALLLALATLLMMTWAWIAPQVWKELDLGVALASLALTWVGVAWALPRGVDEESIDPEALPSRIDLERRERSL